MQTITIVVKFAQKLPRQPNHIWYNNPLANHAHGVNFQVEKLAIYIPVQLSLPEGV
jgi:hypothetical protein